MSQIPDLTKTQKVDSKYRKIYRAMIEKSNQLDEIYKNANAFQRIFQSETTLQREKLQRYCETLIFREPIECGKKAEEILWRRVFYEIINIVKSNKKNLKSNAQIETMYRLHLSSAYGFYNHLILKFQTEFNSIIQLDGFLDFPILSYEKQPVKITNYDKSELFKEILTRMLHKFLICLGDLARYQIEYDPNGCTKLAYKYYQQSLILLPTNGMPLNQLGTLYCSENYGCDAAYYYLYCLSCNEPFMSARENLRLLFIKNRKRYDEIKSTKFIDKDKLELNEMRTKEIKKFLVSFIRIIDIILSSSSLFSSGETVTNQQLQELCQLCLQDFNSCMFYTRNKSTTSSTLAFKSNPTSSQNDETMSYISDDLVFKLILTIVMSLEQLKNKRFISSETGSQNKAAPSSYYFTTVAFALMFFSHIVNHTIIRLQEALLDLKQSKEKSSLKLDDYKEDDYESNETTKFDDHNKQDNVSSSLSSSLSSNASPKTNKKNIRLLYGHRRRKHNSDSDTNESSNDDVYNDDNVDHDNDLGEETYEENPKVLTRKRSSTKKANRKKNIAKFLDRDNLSETELNDLSDDKSFNNSNSDLDSSLSETESKKLSNFNENKPIQQQQQQQLKPLEPVSTEFDDKNIGAINLNENDLLLLNSQSINFKEFSTQLYSRLSILQEPTLSSFPLANNTTSSNLILNNPEEFIDNEIYKFVLNGKKEVSIPPGFENNSKEAEEIEELGKKIATFQIETDTEMSVFNSNSSESDSESDTDKPSKSTAADFISHEKVNSEAKKDDKNNKMSDLDNGKQLIEILQKQALLPTVKVFCDWLLCNKKIIQSISQVSTTIWSKLSVLLNCIPLEKLIANEKICSNEYVRNLILKSFETKSWNSQPLSEDYQMRSFIALRLEHLSLKFDINKVNQLNVNEENLLRLCYLRRFGYLIASFSKSQTSSGGVSFFEYNVNKTMFNAPSLQLNETDVNTTQQHQDETKKNEKENLKLKLMKNMAQLRLEAEIFQLESHKHDDSQYSPYLVCDTSALCYNLKMIQDFSRSKKFIIIIPLVVIDNLDSIKKESRQARDAIRWLENQFKHGNRFLRAQTENEKHSTTHVDSSLKKKDLDLWRFYQLIDCCKYFQEETNLNDENKKKLDVVTLLVNSEINDKQKSDSKSYFNIAKQNNIQLQNIKDFHSKLNLLK